MDLIHSLHPMARAWLLDGPLSSHVDTFQAVLARGRYAEGSVEKALRALAHLMALAGARFERFADLGECSDE